MVNDLSVGVNIVIVGVFQPEDQSVMEKSLYIDAVLLTKLKKKKIFVAFYCGCNCGLL